MKQERSRSGGRHRSPASAAGLIELCEASSCCLAQPQWIDLRVAVPADITIEFYVDGLLQSAATAANTAGRGKPVQIVFADIGLHGPLSTRTLYYAHLAVLDGVSTIGRRFVRRSPNTIASFNQMAGSHDALKDEDFTTRVANAVAGHRLSFALTGPSGPAANSAIAGVHIKQIVQGRSAGSQAAAGFLRIAGVTHDAAAVSVPTLALNPADAKPWTSATLPVEVGIRSA